MRGEADASRLNKAHIGLKRVRHVMEEDSRNEHPHLQIFESFVDLVWFMMNVFHASLVGLETLDCNDSFTFSEKLCRMWRIREDPPQ